MNPEPAPVPNQAPVQNQQQFYVTREELAAFETRIMQRMQEEFNDVSDARIELVAANLSLQQQIDRVREAVRALEHRCGAGRTSPCATAALQTRF
jgi:hypothetical protein